LSSAGRVAGLARIVDRLVNGELCLEVRQRIRAVQGAKVEIPRTELMLGQQGAEHVDRVVSPHR